MPSAAASALAVGFIQLLAIHGETLGYLPAAYEVRSETSEAVTNESGQAVLIDGGEEDATDITGIFDEAYSIVDPQSLQVVSITTAAIVKAVEVPGVSVGAVIFRDGVQYSVNRAEAPCLDGSQVLLLSKQTH